MPLSKVITAFSSPVTVDSSRIIALIGAKGMLAGMVRERAPQNCTLHLFDLPEFDMTDRDQVVGVLGVLSPDVIINCAAFTNVDGAETEQALAMAVNGTAVGYLAEAARAVDATLVHISTDYVFDGQKAAPYVEGDETNPQSVYGRTKLAGEQALKRSGLEKYLIIRTSWLYGPGGSNFVETILRLAAERDELRIIADQVGTPTYACDLADAVFNLLGKDRDEENMKKELLRESRYEKTVMDCSSPVTGFSSPVHVPFGLYHFSNNGQCSWFDFAVEIVALARKNGMHLKVEKILPIKTEDYPLPAKRPAYSIFSKEKYCQVTGRKVPLWQDSLAKYLENRAQGLNTQ